MTVTTLKRNSRLQKAIRASNLTQRAISRQAGISEMALSMSIHGRFNFSLAEKLRVATALGKPISEIFD